MNKISRYILRSSFAPFIFGSSVVIFLFLMQFLMKSLDKLLGKGLDNVIIIQLIAYNISWMVVLAIPMGVLFASLVTFGNMSSAHEVTIIKASGGSLIKMMRPLLFAGVLLFLFTFWYNDYILPETNYKLKTLTFDIQRKKPILAIEPEQFSMDIEGYTILAREVDTATNILYSVTIYDQKQYTLNRTISAESCKLTFSNDMEHVFFYFKNGEIHQAKNNNPTGYRIIKFNEYTLVTSTQGFGFEQSKEGILSRGDREMNIAAMRDIVNQLNQRKNEIYKRFKFMIDEHFAYLYGEELPEQIEEDENFSEFDPSVVTSNNLSIIQNNSLMSNLMHLPNNIINTQNSIKLVQQQINSYEVEIYKKYAIPFACVIFVLVGCPLGIITKRGNFGVSAAITLGFYIVYWACLIGGEKLADRGYASPVLSMWLGNIIVGITGLILTIKINNEKVFFKLKKRNNKK